MRFTGYNFHNNEILTYLLDLSTSKKDRELPTIVNLNPFSGRSDKSDYYFIGDIGITESIDLFFREILAQIKEGQILYRFVWYLCDAVIQDGDTVSVIGHDVYLEAQFSWSVGKNNELDLNGSKYLCGGMTDYSGTGGSGYEKARATVNFLSGMLGTDQRYEYKSSWQVGAAENIINLAKGKLIKAKYA